ncbi:hypothetical protein Tco_0551663 [Tanacetum coccineum]
MEKCDTVSTPMATTKLDADLQGTLVDQTKYRSMIGGLMYLTASRPDIAFATFVCACYQARPTEKHLKEVKRIFRYLRQSINMGLWYSKDSRFELISYADADHAGCNVDCKCTSGGLQFLGDKLVSWSSKKQDCTTMSSVEAGYVSLSACCAQVMWMRTQLLDYGFHYHKISIYCDSKSAIAISCNPVKHSRTKHINIRCHFIKEHVEKGTIELYFVRTEYQLADLFTKALLKERFEFLVHKIVSTDSNTYITSTQLVPQYKPIGDANNYVVYSRKKEAIQYPRFIKLIVVDLMTKFPNIPKRREEDYHSIKDDVPLIRETNDFKEYETVFMKVDVPMNQPQPVVSTQGTHRITPSAHSSPTVSTSPSATKKRKQIAGESSSPQKSLKITIKQKQIVKKDDDDSEDRIEPESHKDNPEVVNDDDDKEIQQKDDEMGSLEIRNEETQTTIPTPLSSPRKILSLDKKTFQELTDIVSNPTTSTSRHSQVKKRISKKYSHLSGALRRMCRRQGYMIQDMERKCVTTAKFWETHNKIDDILHEDRDAFRSQVPAFISKEFKAHALAIIEELFKNHVQSNFIHVHPTTNTSTKTESSANLQYQLYLKMKRNLQDRADDIALWEALRRKFEKSSTSNTSCREDDFHSHHDEHKDDDAPPEGEKRVKRRKTSKRSKSARGSSSKHSRKDSATYNVDKRVPTIFDHTRMEATLRDSLSNLSRNDEEYASHLEQSTNFMENQIYGNTEEKKYILSLHKIHAEEFLEPDLEEKLNRWVRKEFKMFNEDARLIIEVVRIVTDLPYGLDFMEQILVMRDNDKPDSFSEADFKYLNKNDIEDLYYLCRSKLGIESYQMKNLTVPPLIFPGIKERAPYSIVDEP